MHPFNKCIENTNGLCQVLGLWQALTSLGLGPGSLWYF